MNTRYSSLGKFRKKHEKTKQEMANIMCCHINTYYMYENGQLELPVSKASLLAKELKIDWWLLYEE